MQTITSPHTAVRRRQVHVVSHLGASPPVVRRAEPGLGSEVLAIVALSLWAALLCIITAGALQAVAGAAALVAAGLGHLLVRWRSTDS